MSNKMLLNILGYAEISALPQDQAIALAVSEDNAGQRAYITVSKVFLALTEQGAEAAKLLGKAGVRKSTVDNARYASKAWASVKNGFLTEDQFNGMTFMDMFNYVQYALPQGDKVLAAIGKAKDTRKAIENVLPAEKKTSAKKTAAAKKVLANAGTPAPSLPATPTGAAPAETVTPAAPAKTVPSESDLLEFVPILEKGILARVAAKESVDQIVARVIELAATLGAMALIPVESTTEGKKGK